MKRLILAGIHRYKEGKQMQSKNRRTEIQIETHEIRIIRSAKGQTSRERPGNFDLEIEKAKQDQIERMKLQMLTTKEETNE